MTDNEFIVQESGGSGDMTMIRPDDHGGTYESAFSFEDYQAVDRGQYTLEITGFQKRFEMPRPAQFMQPGMDPMVLKTRVEFTVIDGPSQGAFLGLYTWNVGDMSNLGALLRNINGGPLPRPWDMRTMLGWTFSASVIHAKDKKTGQVKLGKTGDPFPDVLADTAEPVNVAPVPDELKSTPTRKDQRSNDSSNDSNGGTPLVSWTAFWDFAHGYGFKKFTEIEAKFKVDFEQLNPQESYELLAELVGHTITA